jgi:hypothetical protein
VNILDENIPESQRRLLRNWGVPTRQVGQDIGRKRVTDIGIIPVLHTLDRPTFFTLDSDFYKRRWCHERYCLVYLDVEDEIAAEYVRRILRHPALNTKAQRMGRVIRASPAGMKMWLIHQEQEDRL